MEANNNQIRPQQQDSGLEFSEILDLFMLHKKWYVISVALCLFLAAFYLYRTPKDYSRNEKVIIDDSNQSALAAELKGISGVAGGTRLAGASKVENELQAMQSPDLMMRVVERLGLETNYIDNQLLRTRELYKSTPFEMNLAGDNMASSFSFTATQNGENGLTIDKFKIGPDELEEGAISATFGDTLVTPAGKLIFTKTSHFESWKNPITVSWNNPMARAKGYCSHLTVALSNKQSSVAVLTLTDKFPARAESILSTLLDIYDETWVDNLNRSARNTSEFINDRLILIEQELGGIEDDLRSYKTTNNLSDVHAATQTYLNESSQMASKALEARNELSVANYVKSYMSGAENANSLIPSGTGLESSIEAQIREYNNTMLQRDRMLAISSDKNPVIQDLNASLDAMKISINRSIDNLISALSLQVNKYDAQERQIIGRISNTTGQQFQLLSIERQQKVKEELYVFLLQKREENELTSLVNVANTRLIQAPNGSPSPISPSTSKTALIALILGLGLPFAWFYLKKTLDTTIHNRRDLQNTSMPFVAEIPQYGKTPKFSLTGPRINLDKSSTKIVVEQGSRNAINEAFRVLRTNIGMMVSNESGCHTLLFTSFNPNAGKTFVSINTAAAIALKGHKVLMLDLDLRKATLSKALKLNNEGSVSYLSGKTDNLESLIQPVSENLSLLSVGKLPPNPSELLDSVRFGEMMSKLKSKFDCIIMDCAPIDLVTDTDLVSKYASLSIFVLRAGIFDKRSIQPMEAEYRKNRFNRMCIMLNGVDYSKSSSSKRGYGYGYGYGHGYGYGYGSDKEVTKKSSSKKA